MFSERFIWGALPSGFTKLSDSSGNLLIVRQERQREIGFDICSNRQGGAAPSRFSGRGALTTVRLADGENALVRHYRHGGVLRSFTGDWFFTWPPRPFRELTITEELRRRGVLTVEVYAACVSRGVGPFYRGWLVTRELPGAMDLWSALEQGLVQRFGAEKSWRAVANTIRRMHREGVFHSDLNLKNILLRQESTDVTGYIIDFDKARLFLGKLPTELAKKNLDRLLRSVCKLDPERRYVPQAAWQQFVDYYHGSGAA